MKVGFFINPDLYNAIHIPKRIVSLVPSQTELLAGLGLEDEVVGITRFCVHPADWHEHKPRVGGTKRVHLDQIRELQPDLILANLEENTKEEMEDLAKDIPVFVTNVKTLPEALVMIEEVGKIVGKQEQAKIISQDIIGRFAQLKARDFRPLRTAYFIWKKPWMSVGGDTFINDMLTRANFINVFESRTRYPEFDFKELRQLNPEIIMLSSEPYPFKKLHIPEVQEAFPKARIVLTDGEMFTWYGTRLLKTPDYLINLRKEIEPEDKE